MKTQEEKYFNEMQKILDETDEIIEKLAETPENDEQVIKASRDYYSDVRMYDWGAGENSNQQAMMDKYGSDIVNEIRGCEYNCMRISKSLIHKMHRIHDGKEPKPRPSWSQKKPDKKIISSPKKANVEWDELGNNELLPSNFDNKYFITKKAGVYNTARKAKSLKNPSTLLDYLLQYKAWKNDETGEYKKDKHNTYTYWYVERKLVVASRSVEQMAVDLGVSESTIKRWANALVRDGIIKKIKVGLENVYVLGKVVNGEELYFYTGEVQF